MADGKTTSTVTQEGSGVQELESVNKMLMSVISMQQAEKKNDLTSLTTLQKNIDTQITNITKSIDIAGSGTTQGKQLSKQRTELLTRQQKINTQIEGLLAPSEAGGGFSNLIASMFGGGQPEQQAVAPEPVAEETPLQPPQREALPIATTTPATAGLNQGKFQPPSERQKRRIQAFKDQGIPNLALLNAEERDNFILGRPKAEREPLFKQVDQAETQFLKTEKTLQEQFAKISPVSFRDATAESMAAWLESRTPENPFGDMRLLKRYVKRKEFAKKPVEFINRKTGEIIFPDSSSVKEISDAQEKGFVRLTPAIREEMKVLGKERGKTYVKIQNQSLESDKKIAKLKIINRLIDRIDVLGKGAPTIFEVRSLASTFGIEINEEATSAAAALNSLIAEFVLRARNPESGLGLTGNTSERDLTFLQTLAPGLNRTRGGNKMIVEIMTKLAVRDQEIARLAKEYRGRKGGFDFGFEEFLKSKIEPTTIFDIPDNATVIPGEFSEENQLPLYLIPEGTATQDGVCENSAGCEWYPAF